MLITYITLTILSAINQNTDFKNKSLGKGILVMIFLFSLGYDVGFNSVPYLYITEVFPFTTRTKGVNISMFVQQVWLIFSGFINPIAIDAINWKYYIVYCVWLIVEIIVIYLSFVETSGKGLEEVAELFGDKAVSIHQVRSFEVKEKC
ncbi:unnamed protein product [Ambrosiozyma monospora]|uniref:Unnamed protein product n=1 Tax=Ambrosiozyma monospora TaxID=43982 RepID=A0A9W7DJH5_AMBMO|nr:unnamed protein product [Ambrosiozyma monospora]